MKEEVMVQNQQPLEQLHLEVFIGRMHARVIFIRILRPTSPRIENDVIMFEKYGHEIFHMYSPALPFPGVTKPEKIFKQGGLWLMFRHLRQRF